MNSTHLLSPLAAWLMMFLFVPVLRKMALKIHLVDKPNARKHHQEAVPLVGGISIFAATTCALLLALPAHTNVLFYKHIFIAATLFLTMGIVDDRFDLRASLKLAIQLILAHFIFTQGIKIESLQGFLGVYALPIEVQYPLTILVIAGVVNAFNLIDGIDGLAAGFAILGFGILAFLTALNGQYLMTLIALTFVGSSMAFLRFNFSQNQKIFMGDAGSLSLGFVMVILSINLLQTVEKQYLSLTTVGVISVMLVPVLDALRVFVLRAKSGKSPFQADRTHLHHLILSIGLKHQFAALAILGITGTIAIIGYMSHQLIGLTFSIIGMLLVFYVITEIIKFNHHLNTWKARIQEMEKHYS